MQDSEDSRGPEEPKHGGDGPHPVHVLAVVGAIFALALLALQCGCSSALADQCEVLYAGADTAEKLAAANAACGPDGGVP